MDHMYAATAPAASKESDHHAKAKSPVLAPCLHDHNFARPPSESPDSSKPLSAGSAVRTLPNSNTKDDSQSSSATVSSGKRQPSPAKSPMAPTSPSVSSKAELPPAKATKLQVSTARSLKLRGRLSSGKITRRQMVLRKAVKRQSLLEKSRKGHPSPEKTRKRQASLEKTRKRRPSPEKTRKRQPSSEKTTRRQPSPEKTTCRQPSPEKTTRRQPSPEKTANRQPSPEKTRKRQPSPEKALKRLTSPEDSTKAEMSPAKSSRTQTAPTMPAKVQSYPPKKTGLRSAQLVHSGKSSAASDDEVDTRAIFAVATDSAPLPAKHASPSVIDSPAEPTELPLSEDKQTNYQSQGKKVNEISSKAKVEQSEESNGIRSRTNEVKKQAVISVNRSDELHSQDSVSFPKVRSLFLSTLHSDQANQNQAVESTNSGKKDSSEQLTVEITESNKQNIGQMSAGAFISNCNDTTTLDAGKASVVEDSLASEHDCSTRGSAVNTSEQRENVQNSATLPPVSNESSEPEAMNIDQEVTTSGIENESDIPSQRPFTCIKASEVMTTDGADSLYSGVDCSILEAVNLRKVTDIIKEKPKGRNGMRESTRSRLAGKKRSAREANIDGSQAQSGLSGDQTASAVKPSKLFPKNILTQSQSGGNAETSVGATSAQKTPQGKKAKLPKPDINKLPFDVTNFLVPMKEHGWKRELVIRGVFDEASVLKRKNTPADVYYFTPEGKKMRSGVMVANYLAENPQIPLSAENFTFYKKPIAEEPYEIVRQAGKNNGRPTTQTSSVAAVQPKSKPPKIPKVKIKIKSTEPSGTSSKTNSVSNKQSAKPSHVSHSDEDEMMYSDGDEDYDPAKGPETPKWGMKRRRRIRKPSNSPEREILIQSFPEPDIILDRAEEAPLSDDDSHHPDDNEIEHEILTQSLPEPDIVMDRAEETPLSDSSSHHPDNNEREETFCESPAKAPKHMMLLPEDIKEEQIDSDDEEAARKNKNGDDCSDMGDAHIYHPVAKKPVHVKPTARKSTMPRVALKKPSNNSSNRLKKMAPLSEGQLCSNACPGLDGIPPALQCCVCMCLFHHQCVGVRLGQSIPHFKCLRCKDVPSPQDKSSTLGQEASSPKTTTLIFKSVPATPTSSTQIPATSIHPSRFVYVHTQPVSTVVTSPFSQPLITMTANPRAPVTPQISVSAQPKIDAIQLLRKLGSVVSTSQATIRPGPSPAVSVAPPPNPPQLIRGGVAPPPLHPSSKLPLPPLRSRPPPRLTAAPGIVMSSSQFTPSSVAVVSSSIPPQGCITPGQPQPQVMSLPANLLSQLNLSQPLALKLNNTQVVVPPSCIISTPDSLKSPLPSVNMKVLLPPSTFPIPNNPHAKLSVTVSSNSITNTSISSLPTSASATTASSAIKSLLRSATQVAAASDKNSSKTAECVRTRKSHRQRNPARIDLTQCSMHRLFGGFDCMLSIFRYLGICDLLRAGLVCKTWQQIARQRILWQRLDLKGLHVTHWDRATSFLHSVGTQTLCLPNIHHGNISNSDWLSSWSQVTSHLDSLTGVRSIEFGLVPSSVLHSVAEKLTWLEAICAKHISDFCDEQKWTTKTRLDVGKLAGLTRLQELRLRGVSGLDLPTFTFSGCLSELANLKHLHTLSLTSLHALRDSHFLFLKDMKQLEVLELGDCLNWTYQTYGLLGELHKLRHLRLVCGGEIPDAGVGEAIAKLRNLERLELILFAIPATMESSFSQLPNLRTLVIWPHSNHGIIPAVVNSHALTAVVNLKQLSSLTWGMVMQRSFPKDKSLQGSPSSAASTTIPLLWPGTTLNPDVERDDSMVVDLSVTDFTKKLCESLPNSTIIKVLKSQVVGTEAL